MTSVPELTPEVFWQHSVAVYGKPGVANACLVLQDTYQVNVNLLLFYHWCYRAQQPVNQRLQEALARKISQTDIAIKAHRDSRRKAKGSSNYEKLKQQELMLEAEQQAALVDAYNKALPLQGDVPATPQVLIGYLVIPENTETLSLINTVLQA